MLKVTPIPIFDDNYVWAISHSNHNDAWIVDPGDASPVLAFLEQERLNLAGLMITHSHFDHIGGINQLLDQYDVPVLGPKCDAIPQVTRPLADGDKFTLWDVPVEVMETPGHLPEHLSYLAHDSSAKALFCADILFSSGCGRIFIGTPQEMHTSLERLKALPADTLVYCAHEYTAANLTFASTVEPDNHAITSRQSEVAAIRKDQRPTLPSTIGLERQINPFLRCEQPQVIKAARAAAKQDITAPVEIFTALRAWKDRF